MMERTMTENSQQAFEFLRSGDADGVKRLLDQDPAASEARDPSGVSLLMQSLYRGRRDLAELIASKKKSLDIFEATALGRLADLRDRIRNEASLINSRSKDGFTALHFAGFFGQPDAARLLIDNGAQVDAVAANPMQVMPLHSAASARNLEAVRLLLEHGAPVNAQQHGGWAPIHSAAQNGDKSMVELLLKHGADPKLANDDGKTPGMVAKEKGHDDVAARLGE
jgi:ankyrin repeat protein